MKRSGSRKSRRDVLKALGAAAAGTVAGGMLSAKEAQAGHGTLNASSSTLGLPAIHGDHTSNYVGVEGTSAFGTGVFGTSPSGRGVLGTSSSFEGVQGFSRTGVGVVAEGATALEVRGPAKFSTSGAGTIAAGQDSAVVSDADVTALSHITVTLTGDPGQAASAPGFKPVVVWVERQPGAGFVVHMSRPVRLATPFTYLIVEPV